MPNSGKGKWNVNSGKETKIGGVIAALLTPRRPDGSIDFGAFTRNIAVVCEAGVDGICLNGATGEYPLATIEERKALVERAAAALPGDALLVVANGAATLADSLALARHAESHRANALLLPPAYFFRYGQTDIDQFYREAAAGTRLPVLIYNLPAFASEVPEEAVLDLVASVPNIAGIKDSSGQLDILAALTRRPDLGAVRMVGNDSAIAGALELGLCDGSISGIAGVLPELTLGVFRKGGRLLGRLDELIAELDAFPTPWGLKLAAECRGLFEASFPLPLSPRRRDQAARFREWFAAWWAETLAETGVTGPVAGRPDKR